MKNVIFIRALVLCAALLSIEGCKNITTDKSSENESVVSSKDITHLVKIQRDKTKEDSLFKDLDRNSFWEIMAYTLKKFPSNKEAQIIFLIEILADQEKENILKFCKIKDWYYMKAYKSHVWAIPYYLSKGTSDNGFADYRCWLISEGKEKYELVVKSPSEAAQRYPRKDLLVGYSEEAYLLGPYVYEYKYPKSIDPGWDFDHDYKEYDYDDLSFDFPDLEMNWETIEEIENLYPEFTSKFK